MSLSLFLFNSHLKEDQYIYIYTFPFWNFHKLIIIIRKLFFLVESHKRFKKLFYSILPLKFSSRHYFVTIIYLIDIYLKNSKSLIHEWIKEEIFTILAYSNCQMKTLIFISYLLTRATYFSILGLVHKEEIPSRKSMHSMLEWLTISIIHRSLQKFPGSG